MDRSAPATPEPRSDAVRKRVTALFADLVGSTAFAELVDPEAARAAMAPYFEMLQSTIEDHAGTVVKFMGDGMLALFGVPEVAEDDALRAVTAGLELQRRFVTFADGVRGRHGVELGLRIGVNTGELVVGDDDADLVGDVLNTAARLEAACEPSRVLVGEDTWRLTRSHVTFEALGDVRVKGKAEPIMAFQAVYDGAAEDDAAPFVGRVEELDMLRAVFDDVVASSAVRLVTMVGAPGVGKTRLAQELRIEVGARSFDVRFERRGSTTFSPIADVLRDVSGSASAESIGELLHDHPEAERLGPVLSSLAGHGGPRTTEESFWAVRRLLELLAADGPVVFVVDDIQWAEPLFWDLLEHLVEWTEAPVLLLALARPELRELRPELTQAGRRLSAAISLEGLDRETTLELAARLLDIDVLPAELADRLPESTEGNPLFVRELVQMLVDDGVLVRDGDRWRLTIEAEAIEVPPTILSLLASRVERLADDERQVVELAAVIGTEFDRGTLAAIAPADVAGRLGALIDRLRRKDLIEPSGQWAGDHPVYRFHHVLIRDAAYRRLLKARRAELHERVGRHLATSGTADDATAEHNVAVAFHFEQVHRYRSELGTVDNHVRQLAADAASRLRSAADDALGREDLPSAGTYAIRALALVDPDAGGVRDDLLVLGCEALLSSGDVTRSETLVDELYERSTDERLAAWADCFRAQLWSLTDPNRVTEAADLAAVIADRLAALGDSAGVAKARLVRASCLARLGRAGDCEAELDLALGAARSAGDRRRTVAVLGAAPLAALWGPSPVARAGGRCLDVLRLLRITAPSPTVEATSIRCQGMLEALRGRFDSARTKFEASRAIARDLGLRHGLFETELFAGYAELLADDPAAAEPHLRAASEGLGRLGIGADAEQAGALLARALLLQGRVDEADELATHAFDTAGQNLQTAITSRAVLAEIRAAQGRHDEARELVDEAVSIVAPTDVTLDHALTLLAAARVAWIAGDGATAQRLGSQAGQLLEAKGVTIELGAVHAVATSEAAGKVASSQPRVWNAAVEIASRAGVAAMAGERDRFVACFGPDFTTTDHGAFVAATGLDATTASAEAWAEFTRFVMAQSDGSRLKIEPIAVRGDFHTLVRQTLQSPTMTVERLAVLACADGKLSSIDWYDLDQLPEALGELDRSYLGAQGLPRDHWVVEHWHRAYATRPEDLLPIMHPDLDFNDRRRFVVRAGGLVDLLAGADAGLWATEASIPRVVRASARGAVYERVETTAGNPGEIRNLLVLGFFDERIRWIDVFDAHDLEDDRRAIRRYDELATGRRSVSNQASELFEQLFDAHVAGDASTIERILPGHARVESRRRLAPVDDLDGHAFREFMAAGRASGDVVVGDGAVQAVRGQRLCLAKTEFSYGDALLQNLVVVESDQDKIVRLTWFDGDQLDDAVAELDHRWLATCGVPADESIVQNWHFSRTNRMSDLAAIAHPDFAYTNHQRFRTGSGGDIDELVHRAWEETEVRAIITEVHRFDRTGAVYDRIEIRDDDEISRVVVLELLDGLIRSFDIFDTEDLDEALALFDGRRGTAPPRTSADLQLSNRAYRMAEALARASIARSRDEMLALLTDDFEFEQRSVSRTAMGVSIRIDRDQFADRLAEFHSDEHVDGLQREPVATRGDDLYLATSVIRTEQGDEIATLSLGESDGTRLRRMTWYDESQLAEALAELDRRYRVSCGIDDDHWITRYWQVLYSVDFADIEPVLHPDFEYVERRHLAWPDGDAGDWRRWFADRDHTLGATVPAIYRLCEHGLVNVRRERVEAGELGVVEVVYVNEVEDERVRRIMSYSPDQLDAAIADFDAFVARRTSGRTLTNTAWELAEAAAAARQERDRDRYASLLTPDFVAATSDALRISEDGELQADAFLDVIFADDLDGSIEIEPIAIRGDDFCLQRSRITSSAGDFTERLMLAESRDGGIARWDYFTGDQLLAAQAELDRRYRRSCGIDDDHWLARFWGALTSFDADAYQEILAKDVRSFDHRALHPQEVGRDEFLAWLRATPSDVSWSVPAIHRLSPRGVVYEQYESWVDDAGSSHYLLVVEFGERRCERVDTYEPHDLDAALARYDEIAADRAREPSNRASVLSLAASAAQQAGDRERFASYLADDFVAVAHDPILATVGEGGVFDRDTYLAGAFDPLVFGRNSVYELEVIAVRGDDLCLFRVRATTGQGDVYERLYLVEVRDGLAVRNEVFPHDQLAEAQIALDHRYLEMLGFERDHPWYTITASAYGASLAHVLSDQFHFVDHRPLTPPGGDRELVLDFEATMVEGTVIVVRRFMCVHDRVLLVDRVELLADGNESPGLFVCVLGPGGKLDELAIFDIDDEAAAVACFEEFAGNAGAAEAVVTVSSEIQNAASDAVDRSLGNEASSLGDRMHELLTARDREGLATIIHDDFVGHSARRFRTMDSFSFDEFVQQWLAVYDTEGTPTETASTVLAVRGDTLALVDVAGEFGDAVSSSLALARSADGKLAELWFFDRDDLHRALDALDELWKPEGLEPIDVELGRRYRRALASGTADDFRAMVTDDYVMRDHRGMGMGIRDIDEYLESSGEFFGRTQMIATELLAWDGPVVLCRLRFTVAGFYQSADPVTLAIQVRRGDKIAVQESFDADDLDAARARFDELIVEHVRSQSPAPAQVSARWAELALEINESLRDRESLLAFRDRFHPDFVGRWASTLFAVLEDADLDEFLAVTANVIDMGQRLELTISEARDDHVALGAYTIRTDDDVAERCIVMRLDDGLLREFVVFDQADADADAARAELDRQWRAVTDGEASPPSTTPGVPAEAARSSAHDDDAGTDLDVIDGPSPGGEPSTLRNLAVDLARRAQTALTSDDFADLRRWSTDEFAVRIERRANPYRSGDLDTYIEGLRSTAQLGFVPLEWRPVAVRGEQLALVRCDMVVSSTGDTLGILALVEVDGAGRGAGVVEYEPEDLDIALRELERRWERSRNGENVGR